MHPVTHFNWASGNDGLVKDFPRARVLLYCSQSAWTGRFKVQQYIEPLASNLLRGLAGEREGFPQRPICSISHNMGGLVVVKVGLEAFNFFESTLTCHTGCRYCQLASRPLSVNV